MISFCVPAGWVPQEAASAWGFAYGQLSGADFWKKFLEGWEQMEWTQGQDELQCSCSRSLRRTYRRLWIRAILQGGPSWENGCGPLHCIASLYLWTLASVGRRSQLPSPRAVSGKVLCFSLEKRDRCMQIWIRTSAHPFSQSLPLIKHLRWQYFLFLTYQFAPFTLLIL